mmetsp:Transcript_28725/g.71163  ORF Transcript_28725/g.71163 Transcript_28725/m.71163 type:complete len:225 (-) Transcript_28725:230-904(-)
MHKKPFKKVAQRRSRDVTDDGEAGARAGVRPARHGLLARRGGGSCELPCLFFLQSLCLDLLREGLTLFLLLSALALLPRADHDGAVLLILLLLFRLRRPALVLLLRDLHRRARDRVQLDLAGAIRVVHDLGPVVDVRVGAQNRLTVPLLPLLHNDLLHLPSIPLVLVLQNQRARARDQILPLLVIRLDDLVVLLLVKLLLRARIKRRHLPHSDIRVKKCVVAFL